MCVKCTDKKPQHLKSFDVPEWWIKKIVLLYQFITIDLSSKLPLEYHSVSEFKEKENAMPYILRNHSPQQPLSSHLNRSRGGHCSVKLSFTIHLRNLAFN